MTVGGSVQAVGVNTYRNDPNKISTPHTDSSVHAEYAALKAMGFKAKGGTIYVARVNRLGEERMSRPCDRCMEAIITSGINKVVYTIETTLTLEEN